MVSTIRKWGNSLGLLVPKQLADALQIRSGSKVELIETDDGILLKPRKSPKVTLNSIVEGIPEDYKPEEELFEDLLSSEKW